MKKILLGLAALPMLAILATSCSTNEIVESKDDKVIKFSPAVGKQTISRATEFNSTNILGETLEVRSYEDGNPSTTPYGTFTLTYNSGDWSYGTLLYHPKEFTLTHYSYHPADGVTSSVATYDSGDDIIVESFNYTVAATAADQKDLMVASVKNTNGTTGDQADATANLVYSHVLSQVNFAIQGQTGLTIAVSNIKVNNVIGNATYTFGSEWGSFGAVDKGYDYVPTVTATTNGLTDDVLYLGNEGGTGVNTHSNALMLMPQLLTSTSRLTFDYEVRDANNNNALIVDDSADIDLSSLSSVWTAGKRYLYTINFDIQYIKFTVDVTTWEDWDAVDGVVDVDIN